MLIANKHIVEAFTSLDELMKGNGPLMLLCPKEMFEMGQFYEWSKKIVNDDNVDLEAKTEVPEEIEWVVGETQSW